MIRESSFLSEKLPFRDNCEHSKPCKEEKIGHIGIQKCREIIIVHKKMQHQHHRKQDDPCFSVKIHQYNTCDHQEIDGENKIEVAQRNIQGFVLQIFIKIKSYSHKGKKEQ